MSFETPQTLFTEQSSYRHPKKTPGEPVDEYANRCFENESRRTDVVNRALRSGKAVEEILGPLLAEIIWKLRECLPHSQSEISRAFPRLSTTEPALSVVQPAAPPPPPPPPATTTEGVLTMVLDTETTGLSKSDVVIEMGYLVYDEHEEEVERYNRLWRQERKSHPGAQNCHKIPYRDVLASPFTPREEVDKLQAKMDRVWASGGVVVAHNSKFDCRLIAQTAYMAGTVVKFKKPVFCTMEHARRVSEKKRGRSCKNGSLHAHLGLTLPAGDAHRAVVDAEITANVFFEAKRLGWWGSARKRKRSH